MNKRWAFIISALAICFFHVIACTGENSINSDTREPAVAGKFYPSEPEKLKTAIEQFLKESPQYRMERPIAIIVPHAGYIYSGQTAADAFQQVSGHQYDNIVILGANHTTGNFSGIALVDYKSFRTPLGEIPVNREIISALMADNKECVINRKVHKDEHSIEVQLPFIQVLFPKARIVPVVIHPPDYEMCVRFGQTLAGVLKNRSALIVISSDLSHYPSFDDAVKSDKITLETAATLDTAGISSLAKKLDLPNLETRACGEAAILAGITAVKALGATHGTIVGYANSGDIPIGDKSRVVGYGAVIFSTGNDSGPTKAFARPVPPSTALPLQPREKKTLLTYARETIVRYLTTETIPPVRDLPARTTFSQGAFVTIRKNGELRGCIGHILGDKELGKTVGFMALEAAFNDPRFQPVQAKEIAELEIEISVLTPIKKIAGPDEIITGRDGVILSKNGKSAVFLPQVAVEQKWDRAEMLDHLCLKAGLEKGCWKKGARFQSFQAEVFSESQYR
jgi:MEMO1 family protein